MKLINLTLNNFKGIEKYDVELGGQSISILGANGTGKTTIADAISWLLFDKDTQDRSPAAFGIKTLDEHGQPIHGLEHSVTGVFDINSQPIMLRKVYKENWTKRKGSSQSEITGHTTDYYWDEEPVSQKEYKERLAEIMSEEQFKMLSLPNYFAEIMHWKQRRGVLTELCGEITDEEIVKSSEVLSGYLELLDGKTQEARVKILRERKKKLNDEIDNIPSRIDELTQLIEDVEGVEDARKSIEDLKAKKTELEDQLSTIRSGGGVSELKVGIQDVEAEKAEHLNKARKEADESLSGKREKVAELESALDEVTAELREATREYEQAKSNLEHAEEQAHHTADRIESAESEEPEPEKDEQKTCPYCKQEMPHDHESDYQEYLAEFNQSKADKIKALRSDLLEAQDHIERFTAELKEAEQKGAKVRARHNQRTEALAKAKLALKQAKIDTPEPDTQEFDERISALQEKIQNIQSEREEQIQGVQKQITEIEQQIEASQKTVHQAEDNRKYRARIADLQEARKKYATDLEEVEEGLNLIDDFNRARAEYITDRVNDRFSIVKWRLFKEQVNGGIDECCDPVVNGVPYSEGLNNAKRVAAGLDIIKTLSQHFEKNAPVCIDNRESVTRLPETGLQIISLIVSPKHEKLTTEVNQELQAA